MISVRYRKCGKARCVCAHKQHPGHGPQYLWNTTQGGKSRAENLRLGPELDKARQEVETCQRFRALCGELVEVNEQICQQRPVPAVAEGEALEQLKKNCSGFMPGDRAGSKWVGGAAAAGRGAGFGGHRDGPAGRDASVGEPDLGEAAGSLVRAAGFQDGGLRARSSGPLAEPAGAIQLRSLPLDDMARCYRA
jgi:hypothetical protein